MSSSGHTTSKISPSNFQLITDALINYSKQTGIDLSKDPLAEKLQHSKSPDDILQLLREREKDFKEYRDRNRTLISCLRPAVDVLDTFSSIFGKTAQAGLIPFPPAIAVFVGVDVLLAAAKGVSSSYDAILDLFESLATFLKRLEIYANFPPTPIMTDIVIKIIVELLGVLSLATKQIQEGRFMKFAKKLFGESEVEAVLQKLDRLTKDEARMTVAQTFGMVHGLVNNMRVVMEDGKASTASIQQALSVLDRKLDEINDTKRGQLQKDIQHWLSPPDPSTNHDFIWKAHHNGTAAWLIESDISTKWKATGSFLWIYGKPGSGKSTLLSAIIEDIEGMPAAGLAMMAYYYFDFRDVKKQDRYGLLSSLVSQLSAKSRSCHDVLAKLYSDNARGTAKPTSRALTKCLKDMLSLPGQVEIYLIIDGLDECPNISGTPSAREEVLELVEELVDLKFPNVHTCVASRPEIDIRMVLESLTSLRISLHDEQGQKEDILKYIKSIVYLDRRMRKWKEVDQDLVIEMLSKKADGMFRWVVCQIDRLRRSFPASIRAVLSDLPKTLDETYGRTLLGIDEEKREYALRLFRCLTVSIRPLRVEELAEIFTFHFNKASQPAFNPDWRPEDAEEAVLSACSSLIAIVDVGSFQAVQFSHFSVKEYLTSERLAQADGRLAYYHILPEPAHAVLAHASLSVLLQLDDKCDRDTIGRFPLASYAARYWVDHAQFGEVSLQVQDVLKRLFDPAKPHFAAWVWLYNIDRPWVESMRTVQPTPPSARPLYYASLCGFRGLVEHLLVTHSLDVNNKGGSQTTALHVASVKGHLEVASLLLENGAEPNASDRDGRTPLHRVSQGGHLVAVESVLKIARLLLKFGAKVDTPDNQEWTPLHTAARSGHRAIAELLLASGASLDARSNEQDIPLAAACRNGKLDVSRLLIDRGSDLSARAGNDFTLLHYAARYGHFDIARLLLDHGVDVTPYADGQWTPLHYVSRYGHLDTTRLLLDRGADLNLHDSDGWTPLHLASANGYLDIVKLLVKYGAIVDSRNDKKETPLDRASDEGFLDILRVLIENGAAVSPRDDEGCTPFHKASSSGRLHVVEFLLECGVDVDIRNENEETPLHLASIAGELDIVRFLIEKGADILAKEINGWNPFHSASQNGYLDVVQLLIDAGTPPDIRIGDGRTALAVALNEKEDDVSNFLIERGADINVRDDEDWTLLHFAANGGNFEMTQLLLDRGIDVNVQRNDLWSPLHMASSNGHVEVGQLLIERGATVDAFTVEGETPLDRAAFEGKVEFVRLLIDHGANLHVMDLNGWTPLHSASKGGHLGVVKLLLRRGANVEAVTKENETPAELASANDEGDVAKFLAEYKADPNIRSKVRSTTLDTADDYADMDEVNASLSTALEEEDLEAIKSLLKQGADVNTRDTYHITPLHLAATEGDSEIVRLLIDRGAEVDPCDEWEETPLHRASKQGHPEIVQLLIDNGADLNARNENHWTPIHLSAYNGGLAVVELLLEHGADVHVLNDEGITPYQLSLEDGSRNIADLLLKHGAHGS